jgi:hypothetical protein
MMPDPFPKCLRCGSDMQQGYIADRAGVRFTPEKWYAGEWERGVLGLIDQLKSCPLLVKTYRCVECGYLESYATEPLS